MRALLDTNIIIHREAARVLRSDIGILFRWLDKLKYEKCIHPDSIQEIDGYHDKQVVASFRAKTQSYSILKSLAADSDAVRNLRAKFDQSENDRIDTNILNQLYEGRVDFLITEDRGILKKARLLGIDRRVFNIDAFLEKVNAEHPELTDYQVLSAKKVYFGNCNLNDAFFDSFKADYPGFESWFRKKSDEIAYVCSAGDGSILAFLYLKIEDENENYSDIKPAFRPIRRLKIGTFKVISNGFKIGERFLKIVFDNAVSSAVGEVYTTIFDHSPDHERLIKLLEEWGFTHHGTKTSAAGAERVLVKHMGLIKESKDPRVSYPYFDGTRSKFIVPIYPEYHTELFPDSILRTESHLDFQEDKPNRNAISKVYISRSIERGLSPGDIVVFYRTASGGPAYYTSVATTIGIVQRVFDGIASESDFIELCRKRSVFTDDELRKHWNYQKYNRPFIVNFLYAISFGKRMNLEALIDKGVFASTSDAPRGFVRLSDDQFGTILENSDVNKSTAVY